MIQELLAGIVEESKISINAGGPISSSTEPQQNLRCPRCDSPNTKFCYYNNYNLTQPRHFCKTCRRYWTKGGALRNVPIGGGCRKAKPALAATAGVRPGGGKPRPDRAFAGLGLDPEQPAASPVVWASTPYSSHLLALLRASQYQNPSTSPVVTNPDYGSFLGFGLGDPGTGFDSLSQLAVGPSNSLWRQLPYNNHHHQQQQQQHTMSSGVQELYQRLRSSENYHQQEQSTAVMCNAGSESAGNVMDPLPLDGGETGYWNPAMSWTDLSAANGAFL